MFGLQALAPTTSSGQLGLCFPDLILNFLLVNFFIHLPALIRPSITLPRDGLPGLRRTLWISSEPGLLLTCSSLAIETFALLRSSVLLFLFNRNTFPLSFFFAWFRSCFTVYGQLDLTNYLRPFQFVGLDIFNH